MGLTFKDIPHARPRAWEDPDGIDDTDWALSADDDDFLDDIMSSDDEDDEDYDGDMEPDQPYDWTVRSLKPRRGRRPPGVRARGRGGRSPRRASARHR